MHLSLHLQKCVSDFSEHQTQVVDGYKRLEQTSHELPHLTEQILDAIYK